MHIPDAPKVRVRQVKREDFLAVRALDTGTHLYPALADYEQFARLEATAGHVFTDVVLVAVRMVVRRGLMLRVFAVVLDDRVEVH